MFLFSGYQNLLSYLSEKQYNKIIVSGFQRSGTTFCSKSLSEDLGYIYVDEVLNIDDMKKTSKNVVFQAPQILQSIHKIDIPSSFVIFMSRNCIDIIKSGRRIKFKDGMSWNEKFDKAEKERLKNVNELFFDNDVHSSYNKHNFFLNYQMHNMKTDYTIFSYEKLRDNKRFLESEDRKNFGGKQISK